MFERRIVIEVFKKRGGCASAVDDSCTFNSPSRSMQI